MVKSKSKVTIHKQQHLKSMLAIALCSGKITTQDKVEYHDDSKITCKKCKEIIGGGEMKTLKVYGYGDGKNRIIVAALTKTAAAKALNLSYHTFNTYAVETGNKEEIELATSNPNILFMKRNFAPDSEFKEAISVGNNVYKLK